MARAPQNVLEAALNGGSVRNAREFALITLDGEGAFCCPIATWKPAEVWAKGRNPCGNRQRDRSNLFTRLDVLVTRRGTACVSTTGANIQLAKLRDVMITGGIPVADWNFPPDDLLDAALEGFTGKKPEAKSTAGADDTSPATL